ncbi:MAG: sigma-70 family RNA polymerase sigma factor [bacterium]|nr:sigma-70 family RNA polymerase sigma factor [bacterium]
MDAQDLYFQEIGKVPLLNVDNERQLARTIEQGREAQVRLCELNETAEALGCLSLSAVSIREAKNFVDETFQAATTVKEKEALENSAYIGGLVNAIVVSDNIRTAEREIDLGAAAKDKFIRSNLRLVVSIAKRYPLPSSFEMSDLIQEGNLGLAHAVDKFDWRKGFKFSTYATYWIRQSIGRAIDSKADMIRIPADRALELRSAMRASEGGKSRLTDTQACLQQLTNHASLSSPTGAENDREIGEIIPSNSVTPEEEVLTAIVDEEVTKLLSTLDDRQRYAVETHYGLLDGEPRSYREVGENWV